MPTNNASYSAGDAVKGRNLRGIMCGEGRWLSQQQRALIRWQTYTGSRRNPWSDRSEIESEIESEIKSFRQIVDGAAK
tara:strand:+ start:235 stop:468 length:234 start_codon:yes stop_codon:yes gene_type:complete